MNLRKPTKGHTGVEKQDYFSGSRWDHSVLKCRICQLCPPAPFSVFSTHLSLTQPFLFRLYEFLYSALLRGKVKNKWEVNNWELAISWRDCDEFLLLGQHMVKDACTIHQLNKEGNCKVCQETAWPMNQDDNLAYRRSSTFEATFQMTTLRNFLSSALVLGQMPGWRNLTPLIGILVPLVSFYG